MGIRIKSYKSFINEGLIKSHNYRDVERYIIKSGFNEDEYGIDEDRLILDLNLRNKDKYREVISTLENVYGWFFSGYQEDFWEPVESNINDVIDNLKYMDEMEREGNYEPTDMLALLYFEPKFSNEFVNVPDVVYHVTDKKYLDSIKKQGLIPKHKDKVTRHPDRIYLFTDKRNIQNLIDNYKFDVDDPVILTIDVSEYKKKNKFYQDPNLKEGGVYVLNNIRPELISSNQE